MSCLTSVLGTAELSTGAYFVVTGNQAPPRMAINHVREYAEDDPRGVYDAEIIPISVMTTYAAQRDILVQNPRLLTRETPALCSVHSLHFAP